MLCTPRSHILEGLSRCLNLNRWIVLSSQNGAGSQVFVGVSASCHLGFTTPSSGGCDINTWKQRHICNARFWSWGLRVPSDFSFGHALRLSRCFNHPRAGAGRWAVQCSSSLLALIPKGVFSAAAGAQLLPWFAFAEGGSKAPLLLEVSVPAESSGAGVQCSTGQD